MNRAEFIQIIAPLRDKFGKAAFDSQKIEILYEELKSYSAGDVSRTVAHFIGEDVRAKVSDFRKHLARRAPKDARTNFKCHLCKDSGFVIPPEDTSPLPTARRCSCNGGNVYEFDTDPKRDRDMSHVHPQFLKDWE